mgnify:CR=1 FL=1
MRASAEYRAKEMGIWPSPLEKRMKEFLDLHGVRYEFQKIFYIYDQNAKDGWITRYYIADFFIPDKNIIIETDGKFHDKQKQHDKDRTKNIKSQYPLVEVLRYKWADLSDDKIMKDMLLRIK